MAARAVQGVAAAAQTPAALALLTAAFPEPTARRRAVGWWTAAAAGGGASGWVLGGVLVEAFGWPAVFLVNVPLCALAAAAIPRVLEEQRRERRGRLDLGAALAVTAALALLVLGLTRVAPRWPARGAAFAAFAAAGAPRADPMLPRWALRRPPFGTAAAVALANTASTTLRHVPGDPLPAGDARPRPAGGGLWCAPFNLAVIAGSLLAPRAGWSARAAMSGGLVAMAAGALVLLAQSPAALLPAFLLMGGGLGASAVASTASGTAALDDAQQGIASGVLNAAAQVGTAIGLAISVPLGFDGGWIAAAAIALAAATATVSDRRRSGHPGLAHVERDGDPQRGRHDRAAELGEADAHWNGEDHQHRRPAGQRLGAAHPDVVLMDIRMPQLDGLAATGGWWPAAQPRASSSSPPSTSTSTSSRRSAPAPAASCSRTPQPTS